LDSIVGTAQLYSNHVIAERTQEKQQVGYRARLALTPAQIRLMDDQAHAARTTWNCLHDWWTMLPKDKRSLAAADMAIRQARKEIDWLGALPAQAAQAVLKTYFQAWKNCWDGRADAPNFKARLRTVMSVDIPQGRDLNITRVHRRWGMANIPKIGRVRFRWTVTSSRRGRRPCATRCARPAAPSPSPWATARGASR
jgi:putative transposase